MPLQYQDQINLIKDILSNQQSDCCGSVSEYQQLERLIKSLMANNQVNHHDSNTLSQIYSYSQGGVNASDLNEGYRIPSTTIITMGE